MHKTLSAKFDNIIGPQVRQFRMLRGWSQSKFALRLQDAGWKISRSGVAKIEARIRVVRDFEFGFLLEVLEVQLKDLFPKQPKTESADDYLIRLMDTRYY